VWAVSFGGWSALAIFYTLWFYAMQKAGGYPVSLRTTLFLAFLNDVFILAVLSPFVYWGAQRFPIERRNWKTRVPLHLGASILYAALHAGIRVLVYPVRNPKGGNYPLGWGLFEEMFFYVCFDDVWAYWPIVGLAHLVRYYHDNQNRKLHGARLEKELIQAQLASLKMQLHPHFLFNSLHAISALMRKDVRAAEEMLASLSELLRMALDHVADQEVSLKSEIEFARRYLAIEQTRFEDRLSVHFEVDSRVLDAQVPNLILQPLVENAVRHAIVPYTRAGRIEVAASREGGSLVVTVRDDGPGTGGGAPKHLGMGLRNTLSRLQHLYGEAYDLQFLESPGGGLTLRLEVPFRTAADERPVAQESLSLT